MDNGSLYDQFSNHEAEPLPVREIGNETRRKVNWQSADNARDSENVAEKVRTASTSMQKDLSCYAFFRFAMGHPPLDDLERRMKSNFGIVVTGKSWDEDRKAYIEMYRRIMLD